jgi:oligopeptide transport system substrate-binding protein
MIIKGLISRSKAILLLCAILVAGILSHFGYHSSAKQTSHVLRMSMSHEPATFDPRKGGDVFSTAFHFFLFQGLTRLESDGTISLSQAEKVLISEDGTRYTFLLKNCFWSDGTPLTAWDYEESWKTILDPNFPSPHAALFFPILNAEKAKKGEVPLSEVGIRAIDAKKLEIQLTHPIPYFLHLLNFSLFYPVPKSSNREIPSLESKKFASPQVKKKKDVICNGPFILKEKKEGKYILKRNPFYFEKKDIFLDEIQINILHDGGTALLLYEKEEIDLILSAVSPIPSDFLSRYRKHPHFYTHPAPIVLLCVFNTSSFPFNNLHLRKAFALSINRKEIATYLDLDPNRSALSLIPSILRYSQKEYVYFEDASFKEANVHLEQALTELNMTREDLSITYSYGNTEESHRIAQILQQQWQKNLGVCIKLQQYETTTLLNHLYCRDYQMAQTTIFSQYLDPMNILERFKLSQNVKNYSAWENPLYGHLLEQSFFIFNPLERENMMCRAEELFFKDMPAVPLLHRNSCFLINPRINNVCFSPLGGIFLERLSISNKE